MEQEGHESAGSEKVKSHKAGGMSGKQRYAKILTEASGILYLHARSNKDNPTDSQKTLAGTLTLKNTSQ